MFKINTVYKMNGGGCYDRLQNIACTIALFLLLVINIFAEVPHTTIAENPNKEVTKVETLKRRDKAELNLSVTKVKSKEIIGNLNVDKKEIEFILPSELKNKEIVIIDDLSVFSNNKSLKSRISNSFTQEIIGNNLIVSYENQPDNLYIYDLNGNFYKWSQARSYDAEDTTFYFEIDNNYSGEPILGNVNENPKQPLGIKYLYCDPSDSGLYRLGAHGGGYLNPYVHSHSPNITNIIYHGGVIDSFCLSSYPENDFTVFIQYYATRNDGEEQRTYNRLVFKYVLRTLKGQSIITFREHYIKNEYVKFNSTTFEEGKPLALENSLTDVTFSTSGKGIVTMQEGDILEIDGKQVKIGSGGNLGVQTATIGNLKYSYKVEAGKLRLALNEWGILEPNHDLKIIVNRNGAKKSEHTLTIDSPRRVEGTNNIKVDNNYQIRNVIKFNGISLDTPSSFALESPIPAGITLAEQTGYGIPLLDEGDILQIDDGRTRTVHSYTIQSGGSLPSQRVEFSNGSIDLQVVNRKVQVRLNNWKVNEPMRLNLRAIRGVNEISNHEITLTAPEAPFNMLETGNLDFGTVLQGAKNKKAESNIRIEMLAGQDVSEVKFNLREEQPVMTNSQGTELKVKSIDKTVQKVRDREYNIKLRGTLDVPEEQQSGEYRGSNILDIEVK